MSYDLIMSRQGLAGNGSQTGEPLTAEQQQEVKVALVALGFDVGDDADDSFEAVQMSLGIQIAVFRHEIGIGIAYWHHGQEEARKVFEQLTAAIAAIEEITGFATYDPQLGRVIDSSADSASMLSVYSRTMGFISKTF